MALQFCPRCGNERTVNLQYCGGCGFDLGTAQTVPTSLAPAPSRPPELEAHTDKTASNIEDLRNLFKPTVDLLEDPLATTDLLSSLAPAFHLAAGPDIIVLRSANGSAGVTVLLQNPYAAPLATTIAVGRKDDTSLPDHIAITLAPLEVGRLAIPLRFKEGTEAKVNISCERQRQSRARAKGRGALDVPDSALGILGGLLTLALTPVGHFSVTRKGGDVTNPFSLPFEMAAGAETGRITYERLWSPAGVPPPEVKVVRRPEAGRVLTAPGYVLAASGGALGALLGIAMLSLLQALVSDKQALGVAAIVAIYGSWIVVGCGLAYGFLRYKLPVVTRPRLSYLGDAVGPGVQLTVGTK
jgi:hypothetical protein